MVPVSNEEITTLPLTNTERIHCSTFSSVKLEVVKVVEVFCVTENLWNETLCTLGDARTYKLWCRYEVCNVQ